MTRFEDQFSDYRIAIVSDLATIASSEWDTLVQATCGRLHPTLRHAFLDGLHRTGCATPDTGWDPHYLTLRRANVLAAAVPLYRKHHSYGEYVFDWAWADAYRKHGLPYYPKLLAAIPFTPVGAPKILGIDEQARRDAARALMAYAKASNLSSLHVLFPEPSEREALEAEGMMGRRSVQFHWNNAQYRDFDDYLAHLAGPKRKKIRAERRKVAEAGVRMRCVLGHEATEADWRFFTRCYNDTYRDHHSTPYLNRAFFEHLGATMGEQVLLVMAERDGQRTASTLSLFDEWTLFGRYWGALEHVPCLHFEACYYVPIEFCIARGIQRFEGGAQGEHKLARGFLATEMSSTHWIDHPAFADAVDRFLKYESVGVDGYLEEVDERNPFDRRLP